MRIKRYLVRDMQEAYERIKEDLGRDAVIISSRKVRAGGIRGLFGGKMIEVTAAVEREKEAAASSAKEAYISRPFMERSSIEKELADVKSMLKKLVDTSCPETGPFLKWKERLISLEIEPSVAEEIINDISEKFGVAPENESLMREALKIRIAKFFEQNEGGKFSQNRVYAFVGPTGVGKTTTLAKIAAQHAFSMGKKVGIVTIDTYRIGAVEQLKTYGSIMGIDVEVVMTPEQLREAVEKHKDKDIVLIDTAGRSPSDSMKLSEVRTFFNEIKPLEVYLVLSCTTKKHDLERIVNEYTVLGYTQLIFTKVDETLTLGSILNLACSTKKPVAYITNGQDVPEDIEVANPRRLAELILGEVG